MSHIIYEPVRQRLQRSELAVPGSSPNMFEKALISAAEKVVILKDAGIMVAPTPSDMGSTVASLLKSR